MKIFGKFKIGSRIHKYSVWNFLKMSIGPY